MPIRNPFRRRQQLPLYDKPARERHVFALICSIMCVICLITSLALPQWATSGSSACDCAYGLTKVYCVNPSSVKGGCTDLQMTIYYKTSHEILISCILSISVLTIISSSVATVISCGFPREKLEFLRHYSVFNIVSLLCIILVAGFWLAVIETLPVTSTSRDESKYRDTVKFGYAYYIYLAAGVFSLFAVCLNLLRARSAAERRRLHRHRFRRRLPFDTFNPPPDSAATQTNVDINEENLPEYTEATTSFMGEDDDRDVTSDTDPLVANTPPPPYAP